MQTEEIDNKVSKQISPMTTQREPSAVNKCDSDKALDCDDEVRFSKSVTLSTKKIRRSPSDRDNDFDQNITLQDFESGNSHDSGIKRDNRSERFHQAMHPLQSFDAQENDFGKVGNG